MEEENQGSWESFLIRIKEGNLPSYGLVNWNGETGQVIVSFHFELNKSEPATVVNIRAWHFFNQLSPQEWGSTEIEVTVRDGKAVRAVFKPRAGVLRLGTARLRALAKHCR